VKARARLGFATGPRLTSALVGVGIGFLLSFFNVVSGLLVMCVALAVTFVNAGCVLRWAGAFVGALLLCLPSLVLQQAREAARAAETAKQAAAAKAVAEEKAKAKADEAARSFKEQQASIQDRLAALEGASKAKGWPNAQQRLQALQAELTPLFASGIGTSPEVAAIKGRLDTQARLVAAAKAAEAARAAQAAETARRAAWTPDPMLMSIRCARTRRKEYSRVKRPSPWKP
jgi:hypothetical protein